MYKDAQDLINLLLSFGCGGVVFISIALYLFSNPNKLIEAWAFLAKCIFKISGKWKKRAIGAQIEKHINTAVQQFGKESPSAFKRSVKIEWISSGEEFAQLEDDQVVLVVKEDPNIVKPLVVSTLMYLSEAVIPSSRPFIQMRILTAIDLVLAYQILETGPYIGATNYLTKHYLEPALADNKIARFYEKSDGIARGGLLTRVILREYSGLSLKLTGLRPTRSIRIETENFLSFVSRFTDRTQEIPLSFYGKYMRCTLALIAKPEVLERSGITTYQRNFRRDIDRGIQVIYLLARGEKNVYAGRLIAKWAIQEGLISGSIPDRYILPDATGNLIPSECIVCFSSRVGRSMPVSPLEEVQIALALNIPETLTGEVEIISIAREPGVITKVLLRLNEDLDLHEICIGKNESKLNQIMQDLESKEIIDFIPWSPDIKQLVLSSLAPLSRDDVWSILISQDLLNAQIIVKSSAAAHRTVGTDGSNLKAAQSLLNIHIDLETRESETSPEEELEAVLRKRIPEINNGSINIIKIARRRGRASKVAVKSNTITNVLQACIGHNGVIARLISDDLGWERVSFIDWNESNLEECLCETLYPLQKSDIIRVNIDKGKKYSEVYIKKGGAIAQAIGREGDNVRLAEEIMGLTIRLFEE